MSEILQICFIRMILTSASKLFFWEFSLTKIIRNYGLYAAVMAFLNVASTWCFALFCSDGIDFLNVVHPMRFAPSLGAPFPVFSQ